MSWMTLPEKLNYNTDKYGDLPAISQKNSKGDMETLNWSQYGNYVDKITLSLLALGHNVGDRVCIYSYNRKEWFATYAASHAVNGSAVSVYHTCSPEEVEWIVSNSGSKFIFVGHNPQWGGSEEKLPVNRLHNIMDKLPELEHVIMMENEQMMDHPKAMSWDDFISKGEKLKDDEISKRVSGIDKSSTASIIYTSGTTGNPKGVELTHHNFAFITNQVIDHIVPLDPYDKYVSWLPQAHVFGQVCDNYAHVTSALDMTIVDNPLHIIDYAKEIQPDFFVGVPRIYEKVYSNVKAAIESKAIVRIGLKIPLLNNIFKKAIRKKAGFSNCKHAITGAAPINPEIIDLFHSVGIPIYEAYGMTETTAGMTFNNKVNNKTGSIGITCPGTEVRVASDGELQFKGDNIMKGYYNNPEANSEVFDGEWLKTGDVGRVDEQGYVYITGRKKEIYVLSNGKNVAPLVIEETMKSISLVSQFFLVGDSRNYCTGLVTLDGGAILRDKLGMNPDDIPKDPQEQIKELEKRGRPISEFTGSSEIFDEINSQINSLNSRFSNPEQVKKFTILPRDFDIDNSEMTPTLKIRRKQINENWSKEINSMYTN